MVAYLLCKMDITSSCFVASPELSSPVELVVAGDGGGGGGSVGMVALVGGVGMTALIDGVVGIDCESTVAVPVGGDGALVFNGCGVVNDIDDPSAGGFDGNDDPSAALGIGGIGSVDDELIGVNGIMAFNGGGIENDIDDPSVGGLGGNGNPSAAFGIGGIVPSESSLSSC